MTLLEQPPPNASARDRLPFELRWLGILIVAISFLLGCLLLAMEAFVGIQNPYSTLIVYTFTPTGISIGVGLMVVGFLVHRHNLKINRAPRPLPVFDFNDRAFRSAVFAIIIGATVFAAVSAVATYRAYHWAESNEFCGKVCHKVMRPEYEALKNGAHSRLACVTCHIGPGVDSFVAAKVNGLNQLYGVLSSTYHLPIETPVKQLRDPKYICEQCHTRARFEDSLQKVLWRFSYDRHNTPSRFDLIMKVGGVSPVTGELEGIHWHAQTRSEVWYWPRDERRLDIPYVEVRRDGKTTVYQDPSLTQAPPKEQLRRMDCLDCHNRPAHPFRPPAMLVDQALAEEALDRKVPYLKRNAVEILSLEYKTTVEAKARILEEVAKRYPLESGQMTPDQQQTTAGLLFQLYAKNNFPEQKVSWRAYPVHMGHRSFPGCARCHDDRHKNAEGELIPRDCDTCHEFLRQSHGSDAYGVVPFVSRPFEHPAGSAARFDKDRLCNECHAPELELSPANAERRGPGGSLPAITETSTAP